MDLHPLEPESNASANSAISAYFKHLSRKVLDYYIAVKALCQHFFKDFSPNFSDKFGTLLLLQDVLKLLHK